jgi:hypothetical protein
VISPIGVGPHGWGVKGDCPEACDITSWTEAKRVDVSKKSPPWQASRGIDRVCCVNLELFSGYGRIVFVKKGNRMSELGEHCMCIIHGAAAMIIILLIVAPPIAATWGAAWVTAYCPSWAAALIWSAWCLVVAFIYYFADKKWRKEVLYWAALLVWLAVCYLCGAGICPLWAVFLCGSGWVLFYFHSLGKKLRK